MSLLCLAVAASYQPAGLRHVASVPPQRAAANDMAPPPLPKDSLPEKLDLVRIPPPLDPKRPAPADNPLTEEKAALGRTLFFDANLSADRTVSCASCHVPERGFTDGRAVAVGIRGQRGRRNAPSLLNRAYGSSFFWDGRENSLEAQALKPIEDPLELGARVPEIVARLQADAGYRARFEKAFPDGVTAANLGRAIASFERTLLSAESKIDRFRAGDVALLNDTERLGLWVFESKGRCWKCHSGPNLSDEQFHNTGVSWQKQPLDLGRYEVTKLDADRGKFKTPSIRVVGLTAPYMHDGSLATLEDVVEFYNRGGGPNPHLDAAMTPLQLTVEEKRGLVAFLKGLSPSEPPK
jgi:cytochrome c peroxidase